MVDETNSAAALSRRLAREAEAVCRHYLPNGRREGRYWLVGDVDNTPGRSLFVRLHGPESGKGAAGKWTDVATGEHGDLLDLIRARCRLSTFREVADEARAFLRMPRPEPSVAEAEQIRRCGSDRTPAEKIAAARRLFAMSRPLHGTAAEAYLRGRGIAMLAGTQALRFHPSCYYRGRGEPRQALPALIAAVTDHKGRITGVHRTWIASGGAGKAHVATPRRAIGMLLGHGVRFGFAPEEGTRVMAAGEGIETMLSLRMALPAMPMIAGLSAAHLGALLFPDGLRRLYVAGDTDGAGRAGTERLTGRALEAGIETLTLRPVLGDFNDDLRRSGLDALRFHLLPQLAPGDARFLIL
jgi:hypothetical protein